MAEIFLSYASQDRDRIRTLVAVLEADGFDVWWDRNIEPGPSFDREIEQAIDASGCVVVAWSRHSVDSEWVRSEVDEGARRGILVPFRLDDTLPPLAYRRRQTADLSDWNGDPGDEYDKLVAGIHRTLAGTRAPGSVERDVEASRPRRRRRRTFGAALLATSCLAAFCIGIVAAVAFGPGVGLTSGSTEGQAAVEKRAKRFVLELPDGWLPHVRRYNPLTITPDGSHIVVNAQRGSELTYLVRPLDSITTSFYSDVEYPGSVWATPDPDWLLFNDLAEQSLRRFRLPGGERQLVARLVNPDSAGVVWDPSGQIVVGQRDRGITAFDAVSGEERRLTTPEAGTWHIYPWLFDEGRKLLYVVVPEGMGAEGGLIRVRDLETGDDRALFAGNQPVVTASGHLVFADAGNVWATAFDTEEGLAYGKRVDLFESAEPHGRLWPRTHFSVSRDGTLVYLLADDAAGSELGWLDLEGNFEALELPIEDASYPRLDAEDRRIAFVGASGGDGFDDIWIQHIDSGRSMRLTFDERSALPAWSADGQWILYASAESDEVGSLNVFSRRADGTGEVERLTTGGGAVPGVPTPDGSAIVHEQCSAPPFACDLALLPLDGETEPRALLEDSRVLIEPVISPDGRWIAYTAIDGGGEKVFVRPFPDVQNGRWQISVDRGALPVWGRGNRRLYFVDRSTSTLMFVEYEGEGGFSNTQPRPLIDLSVYEFSALPYRRRNFDLDRSGERILIRRARNLSNRVVVVVDWFDELEHLVPTRH